MARSARELWALNLELQDRYRKTLEQSYASLASWKMQSNDLSETIRRSRELVAHCHQWIEEHSTDQ